MRRKAAAARRSVVLLSPDPDLGEGVARSLAALTNCIERPSTILVVGARDDEGGRKRRVRRLLGDYARLWNTLGGQKRPIVHVNSALQRTPLIRDAGFVLIAKLRLSPVVLSLHRLDDSVAQQLTGLAQAAFRCVFFRADAIIVTTSVLNRALRTWGYKGPVFVEAPALEPAQRSARPTARRTRPQVLFLSRIVEEKGVLQVLRAWKRVASAHPEARLCIAGTGPATDAVFDLIKAESVPGVRYVGEARGEYRQRLLEESWVLVLPTTGLEAMPTAVMEAMRAGLFVVTTTSGGLAELCGTIGLGYVCDPNDSEDIAQGIEAGIADASDPLGCGARNRDFAELHFSPEVVRRRMERVYAATEECHHRRRRADYHWLFGGG